MISGDHASRIELTAPPPIPGRRTAASGNTLIVVSPFGGSLRVSSQFRSHRIDTHFFEDGGVLTGARAEGGLRCGRDPELQGTQPGEAPGLMAGVGRIRKLSTFVWGSIEQSNAFLVRPNRALGGVRPTELFVSMDGLLRVEKVLNAILHGLPA